MYYEKMKIQNTDFLAIILTRQICLSEISSNIFNRAKKMRTGSLSARSMSDDDDGDGEGEEEGEGENDDNSDNENDNDDLYDKGDKTVFIIFLFMSLLYFSCVSYVYKLFCTLVFYSILYQLFTLLLFPLYFLFILFYCRL